MKNNLDIYEIAKKSSAQDRAKIFFYSLLTGTFNDKMKLKDEEMEALHDSFRNCHEIDLFNSMLQRCSATSFFIYNLNSNLLEIDKLREQYYAFTSADEDRSMIEIIVQENLKEVIDKKSKNKVVENIMNDIDMMCFVDRGNRAAKIFADLVRKEGLAKTDLEDDMKVIDHFFKSRLKERFSFSTSLINVIKKAYKKWEEKFDIIDDVLEKMEKEIALKKEYIKRLERQKIN